MKTGLLFTEVHEVRMDNYNRIKLEIDGEDNKVSILEAIYLRYKFNEYTTEELRFITTMMSKFKHSVHICDIDMNREDATEIYNNIREYVGKGVAVFGTIDVKDTDLITLQERGLDTLEGINASVLSKLDRVIMKDSTTKMNLQHIKAIELDIYKRYGIKKVALCGSPFTNRENCCLNALFARELSALYADEKNAIAVASHENDDGNGCGCVRYHHVNYDILTVDNSKPKKIKLDSEDDDKEPKEPKKTKDKVVKEKKPKNAPLLDGFW